MVIQGYPAAILLQQGFCILNNTMKMNKILGILVFLLLVNATFAQQKQGFVRGNILDGDFGGALIGATISLADNPSKGTIADLDGNFSLPLDPGPYKINVSFISYATQTFDVVVKPGEVTMLDVTLSSAAEELSAYTVEAKVRRTSEVAMLMDMKKASTVSDGMSAQTFRKNGDNDLGGAIKRVTGVTVQDGKHVYVRGLGDRYTKTTLNGMSIPGLDPDKNSVQIDIFPTNVLENVSVSKTFTPELDGDFTGGLIDVVTKKFPDEKSSQVSIGLTYTPGQHFNSDYILYNGGSLDWAAFDDGSRKLGIGKNTQIPNEVLNDPNLEKFTRAFNPQLGTKSKTALPNGSFAFSHGNQINTSDDRTFGYNAVFNYRNETTFYDFESNDYLKNNDLSNNEMLVQRTRQGPIGKNNVLWSGLLSGSYKKGKSAYSVTLLNTQAAEATATQRINKDVEQNQSTLIEDILTYQQRTLSTLMFNGQHKFGFVQLNWGNATSYSRVYDPDFRETRISVTDGDTTLATGTGAGIDRFWRDLTEINNSSKVDAKAEFEKITIKAGASATMKWRSFETISFKHRPVDIGDVSIDPDWYLQEDNIWVAPSDPAGDGSGTFTIGNFQPANQYQARQNLFGGYVSAEQKFFNRLRVIYGVRLEQVSMFYTGENNTGSVVYNDTNTLNELNILPSLNTVYELTDKMNLRAAVNRTVARPTFREKSIAQIYDPITKRTFSGNLGVEQTYINNYDLRWEYFLSSKELISVAGFYKQFDGHIEMVSYQLNPDEITPRNSGLATVAGVEFEVRKAIVKPNDSSGGNWNKHLSRFFVSTNLSLVQSRVDMTTVLVEDETSDPNEVAETELENRQSNARVGQNIDRYRSMSGQSPYAINVSLSYELPDNSTSVSVSYNVQGEQLTIIGSGRVPDIYTIPFHSLNLNAYRKFGEKMNHRVTISAGNLLNEYRTLVFKSNGAENQIFTSFKPGIGIGAKYTYSF